MSEETGDEVVLMKDRSGRVIGFEKLNFSVPESDSVHVRWKPRPPDVAGSWCRRQHLLRVNDPLVGDLSSLDGPIDHHTTDTTTTSANTDTVRTVWDTDNQALS